LVQNRGQVAHLTIDFDNDGFLGKAFADGLSNGQSSDATEVIPDTAIGQSDMYYIAHGSNFKDSGPCVKKKGHTIRTRRKNPAPYIE
jgi:hypothetical protein